MEKHETGRILFVDDEESMRTLMGELLARDGHEVSLAASGEAALDLFEAGEYDLVIQDIRMPGMNGLELLQQIKQRRPRMQVIIMTAYSTWDTAVEAMRLGAYDYIKKPFDNNEVRAIVQRTLSQKRLFRESALDGEPEDLKLIGSTDAMQQIYSLVKRVAPTDSTVVITGESGTGKEMAARLIHLNSLRAQNAFISVNCGAFSETLFESELFGHVRGAFTSAVADKKGLLQIAEGGSFFLDELGEMALPTQVKFLRVLETREFLPVGSTAPLSADVRFITATNRDLEEMVDEGTFREDLFYRLNVIPIHLPPLRERREDIPLLAGHFLARHAQKQNKPARGFAPDAINFLVEQDWPGNIRELENTIQRAVTLSSRDSISRGDLEQLRRRTSSGDSTRIRPAQAALGEDFDLEEELARVERNYLGAALRQAEGNMTRAAELLGISFRQMRYKVKKLDVQI